MSFLSTYWPQIVIIASLLVIIAIFLRRIPKTINEREIAVKKEVKKEKTQERMVPVKNFFGRVKDLIVAGYKKTVEFAYTIKGRILRTQKKEEEKAVTAMFEPSDEEKAAGEADPIEMPQSPPILSEMTSEEIEKKRKADELIRRAKQYLKEDRIKDAEEQFIEAVKLCPKDERIYYELGEMYLLMKNETDAKASFIEAVKLKSNYVQPITKLGLLAYRGKSFDEAAKHYEKAVDLEPTDPKHMANLALALKSSGKTKKAYQSYLDAFKKKETMTEYGINAAELALEMNKPRKAQEVIEIVEKQDPANPKLVEIKARMAEVTK
ncbi:tetratricopeptide repeat protein [Patescibacteria group bacterium]